MVFDGFDQFFEKNFVITRDRHDFLEIFKVFYLMFLLIKNFSNEKVEIMKIKN